MNIFSCKVWNTKNQCSDFPSRVVAPTPDAARATATGGTGPARKTKDAFFHVRLASNAPTSSSRTSHTSPWLTAPQGEHLVERFYQQKCYAIDTHKIPMQVCTCIHLLYLHMYTHRTKMCIANPIHKYILLFMYMYIHIPSLFWVPSTKDEKDPKRSQRLEVARSFGHV